MNIEKLMRDIEAVRPGQCGCILKDIAAIRDAVGGGALETGARCFNYGYLKGQRAAKAEAKRVERRKLERDPSGWYGYLSRWLERNIGNERELELVGVFARKIEDAQKSRMLQRSDNKKAAPQ